MGKKVPEVGKKEAISGKKEARSGKIKWGNKWEISHSELQDRSGKISSV